MNKELIFLCTSLAFLVFSVISILTAPAINNKDNGIEMSKWGKLNCKFYSDKEKDASHIDDIQKYKKLKELCYRKKAMYNLEYSSLIIDIVLGFICTQLGLLFYFKIGGFIEKLSGIFGMIVGIICFILTFIYMCYSGYIFTNDTAYEILTPGGTSIIRSSSEKRFSNGASIKWNGNNKIYPYQNEIGDNMQYIKYKNLGEKQYNYDKRYNEAYNKLYETGANCFDSSRNTKPSCDYTYATPFLSVTNKYLYDNWVTSLIFSCFTFLAAIGLIVIGVLINFKKNDGDMNLIPNTETINIANKQ